MNEQFIPDTTEYFQAGRIESELACLFGRETVTQARHTDIVDLRLDADFVDGIAQTAGQLINVKGQPGQQRELVNSLDRDKRLLLCMWLIDTDLAGKLVSR
jgi:hypothetical protein